MRTDMVHYNHRKGKAQTAKKWITPAMQVQILQFSKEDFIQWVRMPANKNCALFMAWQFDGRIAGLSLRSLWVQIPSRSPQKARTANTYRYLLSITEQVRFLHKPGGFQQKTCLVYALFVQRQ